MSEQANGNAGFRLVRCVMGTMFSVAGMQGICGWTKMIMKMGVIELFVMTNPKLIYFVIIAFFLTFYVFGSCFRMPAVILASEF